MTAAILVAYGAVLVLLALQGCTAGPPAAPLAPRPDPVEVPPLPDPLPFLTVQLPLYNERYVAERLMVAVGAWTGRPTASRSRFSTTPMTTRGGSSTAPRPRSAPGARRLGDPPRRPPWYKAGALAHGLASARASWS